MNDSQFTGLGSGTSQTEIVESNKKDVTTIQPKTNKEKQLTEGQLLYNEVRSIISSFAFCYPELKCTQNVAQITADLFFLNEQAIKEEDKALKMQTLKKDLKDILPSIINAMRQGYSLSSTMNYFYLYRPVSNKLALEANFNLYAYVGSKVGKSVEIRYVVKTDTFEYEIDRNTGNIIINKHIQNIDDNRTLENYIKYEDLKYVYAHLLDHKYGKVRTVLLQCHDLEIIYRNSTMKVNSDKQYVKKTKNSYSPMYNHNFLTTFLTKCKKKIVTSNSFIILDNLFEEGHITDVDDLEDHITDVESEVNNNE